MTTFNEKCYTLLKKVPKGRVTTYKEISNALETKAYQAVGNAMRCNPYVSEMQNISDHAQKSSISDTPKVPCHRVVKSDGNIGGFKGKTKGKEISEKINILKKEGIQIKNNKIVKFDKILYKFK
ncbi:MGMT family protein [archaeon]|nr:MGMT family protein [archaeon]